MTREPYEIESRDYGSYRRLAPGTDAAHHEAAATAFGVPAPGAGDAYLVGGEAPLAAAPVAAGWVDPREVRRRKLYLVLLGVATVIAGLVFTFGIIAFDTDAPAPNPSSDVPAPALDENGNVNPAEGL